MRLPLSRHLPPSPRTGGLLRGVPGVPRGDAGACSQEGEAGCTKEGGEAGRQEGDTARHSLATALSFGRLFASRCALARTLCGVARRTLTLRLVATLVCGQAHAAAGAHRARGGLALPAGHVPIDGGVQGAEGAHRGRHRLPLAHGRRH